MSETLGALRRGAVALLEARGQADWARIVGQAEVELVGPEQTWLVGAKKVVAHAVALVVEPGAYVALTRDGDAKTAIFEAFSAIMKTPETELSDLSLVVKLPVIQRPWSQAYRSAPLRSSAELPASQAVLLAARALADALEQPDVSDILDNASLQIADLPSSGPELLLRCVLLLDPPAYAQVDKDYALRDKLTATIRATTTRALIRVGSVEIACADYSTRAT